MEKVTSKDGTEIAYQRSGTGTPLLLVHGASADHTRWAPILPSLESHFTIYALDRRGRGQSGDTEPYAIRREFEDVATVIDTIGETVNVLAHSFGAFCALEAILLTSHMRNLILYEPPPPGVKGTVPPDTVVKLQTLLASGDREGVVTTFLLEVARMPVHDLELLRSLPTWQGRIAAAHTLLREVSSIEALPPFDAERFKSVTTPTLLLLGGDSPALYRQSIEQIHAMLSNRKIVIMPGQQHVAMNSAPDLFLREVLSFLLDSTG